MKIVAKAILLDSEGNILVLRRSASHPRFAHHLDLPGGEVEEGESEVQAVAREIVEEAGLTISSALLQAVHQRTLTDGTVHIIFSSQLAEAHPDITLSWEHDRHEWLTLEQLRGRPVPPNVDSFYLHVLEYLG